jgi:hypothetical protein
LNAKSDFIEKLKKYVIDNKEQALVLASQGGKSAIKISEELGKDVKIIAISEFTYSENDKKAMKKHKILTIENANLPIQDIRELRETLLMFDNGIKAALEVASIAASKGLADGKYVAIAGSDKGLDTALVVNTLHPDAEEISEPLKRLKIEEIIASPLIK